MLEINFEDLIIKESELKYHNQISNLTRVVVYSGFVTIISSGKITLSVSGLLIAIIASWEWGLSLDRIKDREYKKYNKVNIKEIK